MELTSKQADALLNKEVMVTYEDFFHTLDLLKETADSRVLKMWTE